MVSNVPTIHLRIYKIYQKFQPLIFYGYKRLRGVGADLPPPWLLAQISFEIWNFWLSIFSIEESKWTFWYEYFWRKYPWQFPAMNICPISRNPQPNIFFDPPCTLKTTNCSLPIFIYLYLVEKIAFRGKSNEQLNERQAGLSTIFPEFIDEL